MLKRNRCVQCLVLFALINGCQRTTLTDPMHLIQPEDARRLGYKLKAEYQGELTEKGEVISFYRNGDRFSDMCRGGHVESFGAIPAFKLLSASGAYWRGDADGIPMQRIHGTAFLSQKDLEYTRG